VRQPSVTTLDKLRGTSPFSSVTFALPEASRRFRASPSDAGPRRALRCFVIFGEPSGRCFVIFGEPSGILRVTPPSRGGDCPTVAPRGRGPTPAGRTLEKTKIDLDTHAKASPLKVGGGRDPKVFCYTCRGMICRRSDFSSILPLSEQCEVTPL